MYLPEAFSARDPGALDRLAAHNAFGTLVSQVDGTPFASHLPVLYRRDGDRVTLTGHWARANPQWRDIEGQRALFILQGPHAYVSPRWYTEPRRNVPTWNYAVAHLYGRVRVIQEGEELERIVTTLAVQYEAGAQSPWRFEDTGEAGRVRLKAIVGFELSVTESQVKLKMGQNHSAENVRGAVAGLRAEGSGDSITVASWMEDLLAQR